MSRTEHIIEMLDRQRKAQTKKLDLYSSKPTWRDFKLRTLQVALEGECDELDDALEEGDLDAVIAEAADVANYAGMIIDVATELKGKRGE